MLERLDPNPEYWEGKRGACVGVFQMIIAGREDRLVKTISDILIFIIQLLQASFSGYHTDIKKYVKSSGSFKIPTSPLPRANFTDSVVLG